MAVVLLGVGCSKVETSDVLGCPPPEQAVPVSGIRTGSPIANTAIRNRVEAALAENVDFVTLRAEWEDRGIPFSPSAEDYLTAIDGDGEYLVGLSVQERSDVTNSRLTLVVFYPTSFTDPSQPPQYLYMTEIFFQGPTSSIRYWGDSGRLGQCETLLPQGETLLPQVER